MTSHFRQRLLLSIIAILTLVISIFYSHHPLFKPLFIAGHTLLISLALREYYHLAQLKGFTPLVAVGIGSSFAYIASLSFSFYGVPLLALPSLILLGSLLLFFLIHFNAFRFSLGNLAITVFGIVYLILPLACALRINYFFPSTALQDGRLWLAYVLIVSKATDVGAYFTGKSLGRIKLAPLISPKKTVEGAVGGLVSSLLMSVLFATLVVNHFTMTLFQSLWIGFLLSLLSQLGDLAESLLKRDAGVKDSSHIPGLGGILDMVDSLVFTLPFLYLLLEMHIVGIT